MATASQIDEIKSTLQRGLENLALSGNLKPLPLRQQAQRPVLRNQSRPSSDLPNQNGHNDYVNGGFHKTLSNSNLALKTSKNIHGGYPKRPLSAKGVNKTKRGTHNVSSPSTAIVGSPLFMKPPSGKPKFSRPSSGKRPVTSGAVLKQTFSYDKSPKRTSLDKNNNVFPGRKLPEPPQNISLANKRKEINNPNKNLMPTKVSTLPSSKSTNNILDEDDDDDGEEWCDIDETEDFDPSVSERLPADGASYDDLEEDDGLDGLNDEGAEDDESDGYSIASGHSFKPVSSSSSEKVEPAFERSLVGSGSSLFHVLTSGTNDEQPALSPSLFSNVPPTVNFVGDGQKVVQLPWELRKLLKWRMSPITPNVVKNCIARSGFRATKKPSEWIGYWGKHMKGSAFRSIKEYQKVNHIPGSFQIGRKDRLWKNLHKMQLHYGKKDYNFFPQTFVLPFDLKLLKRAWEDGTSKQKWIIKPPASARGIGVRVIHKWSQIPRRRSVIVQKYLSKPYLINGSKFDLRIYVYLSCCDPLKLYIYNDGLARFATIKYSSSMKNLSNKFMHLTNYSINKKNSDFTPNDSSVACEGHKWGLQALWGYMRQKGIDTDAIWENIKDLVIKTIVCSDSQMNSMVKANVRNKYSVHELFGFDVMLDENLKPWIIEVNISPSLHCNSPLDIEIKGGMIKDLMNMAGFQIPEKKDVYPSMLPASSQTAKSKETSKGMTMDKRLFTYHLTKDERAKHAFYTQKHLEEQCRMSVLDTLTPDDLRCIIDMEDEDSRSGNFHRLFPSPTATKYVRFFESPRYYNTLLLEWVQKYHRQHARGLSLLEDFCSEKVHLGLCKDNSHVWTPVSSVLIARDGRTCSAPSTSLSSPTHPSLKKSSSAHNLPKIRKPSRGRSVSSSGSVTSVTSSSSIRQPHPPGKPSPQNSSGHSTPS